MNKNKYSTTEEQEELVLELKNTFGNKFWAKAGYKWVWNRFRKT